ncbi:MAG: hypothetical protein RIR39_1559 [Pseudomonadota bacterium]
MTNLTLRSIKGAPLTIAEVDANFQNLNNAMPTAMSYADAIAGISTTPQSIAPNVLVASNIVQKYASVGNIPANFAGIAKVGADLYVGDGTNLSKVTPTAMSQADAIAGISTTAQTVSASVLKAGAQANGVTSFATYGDIPSNFVGVCRVGNIVYAGDGTTIIKSGTTNASEITTGTLGAARLPTLTKAMVGLSNVDNTSDLSKPASTATLAAQAAAEAARDAALIQAGVYTTEALGRAAVADGQAFKVQGSGDVAAYEYRRTNSTTSVLIATYPSSLSVLKNRVAMENKYVPKRLGKNLFNPQDPNMLSLYFIDGNGIAIATTYPFAVTGLIPIDADQTLKANFSVTNTYSALYTLAGVYIPGTAVNANVLTNSTGAAAYARFSIAGGVTATTQVEIGTVATSYVPYTEYQPLVDANNSITLLASTKVNKVVGKNLFNPNDPDIIVGKFITYDGSFTSNPYGINITGKIPISAGQTLKCNYLVGNTFVALYSADGLYIAGTAVNSNSITYAAGASYARFSYYTPWNNNQIEVGTVSTSFSPYTEYAPAANFQEQVPDRSAVTILPSKLYFVKGFESSLYYENVLFKNLNDPTQLYVNVGINYNRQCVLNFATALTNGSFTAQTVRSFKLGELKTLSYDVKDPATNNGKTVNILYIGDSFTDIGTWNKKVTSLLVSNGVTVNEIGTTGNSTFKAEGLSGGNIGNTFLNSSSGVARIVTVSGVTVVPETGYPGTVYNDANNAQWTIRGGKVSGGAGKLVVTKFGAVAGDFATFPSSGTLTKLSGIGDATITYSSPINAYYNPFIKPSTGLLDITNYITYWGFNAPNVVVFQFTWNDTGNWSIDSTLNSVVANFKTAADHVHTAYPSAKVIFSIEPFGSFNGNREFNGKKYTVLRFMELLISAFEVDSAYNTWVKLAPSYAFVDLVYGYSGSAVAPSSKYPTVTEQAGGDGVHPRTEGMEQIGECVYQIISNII